MGRPNGKRYMLQLETNELVTPRDFVIIMASGIWLSSRLVPLSATRGI
jgi:hypothetical protein